MSVITRRAGSGADAAEVAAAARRAHDDLAVVLIPLISEAGFDALLTRALHVAKREYPSYYAEEEKHAGPFDGVDLWLERQDAPIAAAAAMFTTFSALLAALIGDSLTTRYLQKAWPDGFSDTRPGGKHS